MAGGLQSLGVIDLFSSWAGAQVAAPLSLDLLLVSLFNFGHSATIMHPPCPALSAVAAAVLVSMAGGLQSLGVIDLFSGWAGGQLSTSVPLDLRCSYVAL
jgi:hypothetical protein